jgi:AcrR family transcriptional regulator
MMSEAVLARGSAMAEFDGEEHMGRPGRSDGRNRRAAETRRKILAAAKEMIAETSTAPTVVAVAKRADVSVRSVFQHFGDVESLFVTVCDSIRSDIVVPPHSANGRPLEDRIAAMVGNLGQIFDRILPLRVAAGQFANNPGLIERAQRLKSDLRQSTVAVFEPEFAVLSEQAKEELADAVGVTLSLEAWVVLRRRDGMSFERATAVWHRTLSALLAHGSDFPPAPLSAG